MKLGAENRTKTILAIVLLVVAGYVVFRSFSTGSTPTPSTTTPPTGSAAAQQAALNAADQTGTPRPAARKAPPNATVLGQSIDPRLRLDLLNLSQNTKYEGAGRNIFGKEAEIPKPTDTILTKKETPPPPQPTGPPPPPPINIKFFGFASRQGEAKQVFLSENGDVFVAKEGDIVNRRYRIVRINPTSIEVEDVLSNNRQSIPLTAG